MIIHICTFTVEVQSFDALMISFVKEGHPVMDEMANKIQETAREVLGNKFGILLRVVDDCALD
jgi:hypothetical protein